MSTSTRKLISLSGFQGFVSQLLPQEKLAVEYRSEDTVVTEILEDSKKFEDLVYIRLQGSDILRFYALPIHTSKHIRVYYDLDFVPSTVHRPVEDLVLHLIDKHIPVSSISL